MLSRFHNTAVLLWIKFLTDNTSICIIMGKIKVTLVKSKIGTPERQKKTVKALGLGKMNSSVEVEGTPQILGMVNKVKHLVSVENI
jgi:large subunit ribosomal protein L30